MQHMRLSLLALAASGLLAAPAQPQTQPPNPTQRRVESQQGQVPVYHVTVVARTTPAINYRHRGGATTIGFRGTPLLPAAHGEAKVESKQGYIEIEVEFDELEPATRFGPEYLTYVLWAVTPEGRATNLGEVLLNGTESKLDVTTELQTFGLVVTAEPYFAVSQPSDVVVMDNVVRPDTRGVVEQIEARYELLKRGTYLMNVDPSTLAAHRLDEGTPLELEEARNALQLSRFAGADRYAPEAYQRASLSLQQAEDAHERREGRRAIVMPAREAAQMAEDARLIALQRQEEERVARAREKAEAERAAAERARIEAEAGARRAEQEKAGAEAARAAAEQARQAAEAETQRVAREKADAEAARQALLVEADQAREAAERAEREKAELREQLRQQLSLVLETRESARGLIVSMPDVLFDTARDTLKPGAREKLAKVAGVLLTYPNLTIAVEGHADSVGTEDYNQALSERRAAAVRAYLVQQGVAPDAIGARGLGEAYPVASNDTAAGRQLNRRVELVVSGEAITASTAASRLQLPPPDRPPR